MMRVKGWEQRLVRCTIAKMREPWKWGTHDCAIFAADCILAVTGEDLAEDFRGQYDTEAEAWRFLASLGYEDLAQLASSRLPEIKPRDATRGDITIAKGQYGDFLGVCDGLTLIGPVAPRGIRHSEMSLAYRAWRVG
jgi:hypothetical protein